MRKLAPLLCLLTLNLTAQDVQADFTPDTELQAGEQHMLFSFPDYLSQPDGMALDQAGNVYVSNPNFNNTKYPGLILKVTPDYEWSVFYASPASPDTKKAGPMGISFGPDGNLYIADNQYYSSKDYASRILRLNMKEGKPTGVDVVATGLKHPNAVRWHDGALYVTDTKWEMDSTSNTSGIWRFPLDALNDSIHVEKSMTARYLIDTLHAIRQPNGKAMGTDGMDFDSEGNMFVGMFSDGRVFKYTLKEDGTVDSRDVFVDYGKIPSCDGIFIDRNTDNLYIADSQANALRLVTPDGTVHTLAENGDTNGADGKMDQPCEPLLVGDKLWVANFDSPNDNFVNTGFDDVHNMTIIQVPAKWLGEAADKQ
ncbi:SMP-30/gluconolactonase/LRE family protein [Lewinella sp. IMCC34183]|uniref:SMP-30/gluconolactonase/LRE family protein n=1 Tax=Lewinella sp. IMCC34183 TaxID=2248762 RepID=UPI000E257822|nr:SMP-30/gluconolactonase/LRE family protein [Lewinella sp. IMCC34183]